MPTLEAVYGNPFLPFGGAILTYTWAVGFTSPSSPARLFGLALMLYTVWSTYACLQTYKFEHAFYSNFLGGSSCSIVMKYIEWALLSRWSFEARGPTSGASGITPLRRQPPSATEKPNRDTSSIWRRFCFGIGSCFDERMTHTPWQVKGTPVIDTAHTRRVPTKKEFYFSTLSAVIVYGLILDAMGLGADNKDNAKNFGNDKVGFFSRLDQLTAEEIVVRIIGTLIWWAASFWLLQVIYNLSALVLVSLNLSDHERWAPMFGRISDCWSIRQFWGVFWQQCMRRKLTGLSYFTLHTLLGLPEGGIVSRYTTLTLVFFWSGVAHIAADLNNAIPLAESGAFRFYMTQAMGIILEDGVRHVYRSWKGVGRDGTPPTIAERSLGHVWTLAWLVWTTPSWAYPSMARSPNGPILPITVLGAILPALSI